MNKPISVKSRYWTIVAITSFLAIVGLLFFIFSGYNLTAYSLLSQLFMVVFSTAFGIVSCFRWRHPLYLQIITGGFICCFFGQLFLVCRYIFTSQSPYNFSIATLSFAGFYFFIFSAEYGALDTLVDNKKDKSIRLHKGISYIAPITVIVLSTIAFILGENLLELVIEAVPMVFASYFILKHIIIPDIDLGFTKPLREYYLLVMAFLVLGFLVKIFAQLGLNNVEPIVGVIRGVILLYMMPAAVRGVSKWYI